MTNQTQTHKINIYKCNKDSKIKNNQYQIKKYQTILLIF
jgi:hypothetical protein